MNGRKLPTPPGYAGEMLEFLAGAVITGVMFPDRWDGKWCLGRHDGQFGAFPVKAVEVCKPTVGERPVLGGEGMQVVARWKWPPITSEGGEGSQTTEGKEGWGCMWLSFGKGELIYDVQCEPVLSPSLSENNVSGGETNGCSLPITRCACRFVVLVGDESPGEDRHVSQVPRRPPDARGSEQARGDGEAEEQKFFWPSPGNLTVKDHHIPRYYIDGDGWCWISVQNIVNSSYNNYKSATLTPSLNHQTLEPEPKPNQNQNPPS